MDFATKSSDASTSEQDPPIKEEMETAVASFKARQKQSDDLFVAWLQSRIEDIENATDAGDKKQTQTDLAGYWGQTTWSAFKSHCCSGRVRNLLTNAQTRSTSTLQDPLPQPQRDEFIKQLQNAINRFYDEDDPVFKPIQLPGDYIALLSITKGIKDADVRRSGICGIDDISQSPLHEVVPEPEKLPCHIDYKRGWDIDVGFILGRGQPPHHNWLVYGYCARKEVTQFGEKRSGGDIHPHERVWKWRLFYKEKQAFDRFVFPMVFESIADWLSWYREWYHRFMEEHPKKWAQIMEDMELFAGHSDGSQDSA
jgi:hypothetical protein